MTDSKDVLSELKAIREELGYIKAHMVDVDMVLTSKEEMNVNESIDSHKRGKAKNLDTFESEMR